MAEWDVPGYDLLELLGVGSGGQVWLARERCSKVLVALRRVARDDRAAVTEIRTQATAIRLLPTVHLIRLRTTTRAGRDDVLVLDHASGGSLRALVARRGALEPGEVVTALAPIAEALGQAHDQGLVHGRLRASEVLLTAGGMPLLDGLGLSINLSAGDSFDPTGALGSSADVWALGALGHLLLTGEQPGRTGLADLAPRAPLPLVRVIDAALGFDPTTRPSAAELSAALLAACPATPLAGLRAPPEPPPSSQRGRLGSRRAVAVAGVGSAVIGVVVLGWSWGLRSGDHAAAQAPRTAAAPDWKVVLDEVDAARAAAFSQARPGLLVGVYTADSPLLTADVRAVTALRDNSWTAKGVRHLVEAVSPLQAAATRVELRVAESLGAYDVLDGAGRIVSTRPAGKPMVHTVVLVRTKQGWRVSQVIAST